MAILSCTFSQSVKATREWLPIWATEWIAPVTYIIFGLYIAKETTAESYYLRPTQNDWEDLTKRTSAENFKNIPVGTIIGCGGGLFFALFGLKKLWDGYPDLLAHFRSPRYN